MYNQTLRICSTTTEAYNFQDDIILIATCMVQVGTRHNSINLIFMPTITITTATTATTEKRIRRKVTMVSLMTMKLRTEKKNKNKIPSLDENGFPLPSDNDDNDDEEGEGDGDTSSSRRRNGEPSSQVFVGGLPKTATEDEVAWFFSQYGPVSRVRLIYDKETGASKRYGFVEFVTPEAAAAVQGLKNLQFQNRMIDVNYASRNIGGGSQNYAPRQHHQHMMMMQQMVPPFDAMGNPMYYPPNGMMIPPPYFVDHRHNIDNSYNSYNSVPNPNGGFLPPHGVFRENTTMPTMETVFDSLPSSQQVLSETGLIE